MFDISNRTAVITGGTGVLGSVMATGLAEAGCKTIIIGRRQDAGDALVTSLKEKGLEAFFVQANVLDAGQLLQAREKIRNKYGRIDILVNAAGGNLPGAIVTPAQNFFDLDIHEFEKVVDLNLTGSVLPSQILCEDMAQRKEGVIINIASMSSYRSLTRVVGYSAAKSAVKNFTEWLAVEMAKKFGEGIRVNAIAPGFFLTEQNRALLTNTDGTYTERGQSAIRHTPFNRFGKPEELIGTLIWLCSDASKFVTGVTVPVDGGFSAFGGV
jgi:NAD(P)-dependent dehydrogenase (short-subunit alcohol dehydrogenase family)